MVNVIEVIERKRDGGELEAGEIISFIEGYMSGEVAEYQMSAWLMAAFLKGLSLEETLALTDALIASGERLDLSSLGRKVVDKHSTGGVGDKVTLVVAPLVAACGAVFGKMSGRCLGHTGGTVDKLESIPGFQTEISVEHFLNQLAEVGVCVAGQTLNMAPADKRLYSLRDVTATIDSDALTAASIMSKKLAGGAGAVVLDIKVGRGAFFRTREDAGRVAGLMRDIGDARGMAVEPVLTAMEQPLGRAVGNILELNEAVAALKGEGPEDLAEVVVALAGRLLHLSDLGWEPDRAEAEARACLEGGGALEKLRQWVFAQGGDPAFIDDPKALGTAPARRAVTAPRDGWLAGIDALAVGHAVVNLGGGRLKKDCPIDHRVGVVFEAKAGDRLTGGDVIATVHAASGEDAVCGADAISAACRFSEEAVEPPSPLIV